MKRVISTLISLIMILTLLFPISVYAEGDGNIGGGGGGMGDGTADNSWSPGNDGVRVTIVRVSDNAVVTTPIDISNKNINTSIYNFGKVCKLQYSNGKRLKPVIGNYVAFKSTHTIPRIVSEDGENNIPAIKSYFTDEQVIRSIAGLVGMNYDVLINGEYKILLEPFAFYKFEGTLILTTATEAAMYDEILSGLLGRKMRPLTHKNLPLAMFLEFDDLGYRAWSGSTNSNVSTSDIKSSLGIGIISFKDKSIPPSISTYDYEYRVNTEVITSVIISGGQSDPDNPSYVNFNIDGVNYIVDNVYYPYGSSQIAWLKWTTPSVEKDMVINVYVYGLGGSDRSTINVKIVDLNKNPPPNPTADDRNYSFSYSNIPSRATKSSASWTVWTPWWREYWVWYDIDKGIGFWYDEGWWEFDINYYNARLSASMNICCDNNNPTSNGRIMKSGYGINQTVNGSVSSNQSYSVTQPQNAVSYFPEFGYKTYWRLLERVSLGRFEFQKNIYSTYKNRTHFTPIWMPDGAYTINTWLIDAWTPDGMLSANLTDSLTIRGNLWEDWHIAPKKP